MLDSNQRPLPCEGSALPLSQSPVRVDILTELRPEGTSFLEVLGFSAHAQVKKTLPGVRCQNCEAAVIRWHCTNERFTVGEFVRANCEYPVEWDGCVERVWEIGGTLVTVTHVWARDGSSSHHVTSSMQLEDDRILSMDEWWAEDGPAPQWHQDLRIGRPIAEP